MTQALTGWAQVNGRDSVNVERKAELDGEYRRRMSISFDAKVMLKSITTVVTRAGYAVHIAAERRMEG